MTASTPIEKPETVGLVGSTALLGSVIYERDSIAEMIGFKATKSLYMIRRALRPDVGDIFITRRRGSLGYCQVEFVDLDKIGVSGYLVETGEPTGFFHIKREKWKDAVWRALRLGCEFRPAPVSELPNDQDQTRPAKLP